MKKPIHHIQKQHLVLDFSTEEKAKKWHKSASSFYFERVLPLVNTVLDKYFSESHFYYVDNLEIDLGIIEEKSLQEAFLKKTEQELTRHLTNLSVKKHPSNAYEDYKPDTNITFIENNEHLIGCFYYFLDHGTFPWNSRFTSIAKMEEVLKLELGLEKLARYSEFQHRLKKETIRRRLYFQFSKSFWEVVCKQLYEKELSLLHLIRKEVKTILLTFAIDGISKNKFKQEISKNITDWIGIAAPIDKINWAEKYILWVIGKTAPHLDPLREKAILLSLKELFIKYGISFNTNEITLILKTGLDLAYISHKNKAIPQQGLNEGISGQIDPSSADESGPPLSEKVIKQKPTSNQEEMTGTEKAFLPKTIESNDDILKDTQKDKESISPKDLRLENQLTGKEYPNQEAIRKSQSSQGKKNDDGSHPTENTDSSVIKEQKGNEKHPKLNKKSKDEGETIGQNAEALEKTQQQILNEAFTKDRSLLNEYYVQHAGLILCWTYLSRIFKHLDFLDGNTFKDEQNKQRAIHLLAFIASGREQCEEHELVIAKFLCGWPLQMPIIKSLQLTDEEKNEANQMLQNLIANWPVLKNTSIDGLRDAFFSRSGKFFQDEESWRLIIEPKSYDMLLDHLPYTISIIKLPWMKEVLKVDWA
ncbi:hypothetical protein BH23BAC1_BH23BAC1_17800 [soil metagenome]